MDALFSNSNYDPNEELPSPSIDIVNQMLNSPSPFLFNKVPTPAGMNPSNQSSLSSPPQSITLSDIFPFDGLEYNSDGNNYQLNQSPVDDLGATLPMNDHLEPISINNYPEYPLSDASSSDCEDEKLIILAEPREFFRGRYDSEVDSRKNRARRYIRTEEGTPKYDHPTIKLASKWRDPTRRFYIRVTSVTVQTKQIPYHCTHPYKIDTQEKNVHTDENTNSIYFPINPNEIMTGEKSFLVSLIKMVQSDLKAYNKFRILDSNEFDDQHSQNLLEAKQKIALYQLWKSQLVFTVAELQSNSSLVLYYHTSVASRIIIDETSIPSNSPTNSLNETTMSQIKCIPQRGVWQGGEEMVLIMPNLIKKKEYRISFHFGEHGIHPVQDVRNIDTKTILFRTPRCPLLPGNEDIKALIIIQENQAIIHTMEFSYITPNKTIINSCPHCQGYGMNDALSNKRRWQHDSADSLVLEIDKLSIEQKSNSSHSRKPTDDTGSKFDKYLNQLKDALELFVRKNDSSRLFRRTRVLLSKYEEDSSPLNEAIENGHTQIALSLIEQVLDMPSPNRLLENENNSPLLIAAKFNQWKIMELILKNRLDLIQQTDQDGNNLFHLLTNLKDDQGVETIDKLLKIFPNDLNNLFNEENNKHQTPIDIAQSNGNTQSLELLMSFINNNGKNQP